jgi:hypothetical protein
VQADLVRDTLRSTWTGAAGQQSASYLGLVTQNPGAYQEFLRGESVVGTSPAELHEAVRHFESAAALDPDFALAWAEGAEAHLLIGLYYEAPREHMIPLGLEMLEARKSLSFHICWRSPPGDTNVSWAPSINLIASTTVTRQSFPPITVRRLRSSRHQEASSFCRTEASLDRRAGTGPRIFHLRLWEPSWTPFPQAPSTQSKCLQSRLHSFATAGSVTTGWHVACCEPARGYHDRRRLPTNIA